MQIEFFLDSGAYSWKAKLAKHGELDEEDYKEFRDDYIDFIKRNLHIFPLFANLDVIGNAEGTLENQRYFEANDLRPIPVFHYGNDTKYLELYLNEGYDYIALGGLVAPPDELRQWLDRTWSDFLTDDRGYPIVKVHGFGMTAVPNMIRYPWYSIDSSTWMKRSRFGACIIPPFRGGRYRYDQSPISVYLSERSGLQKDQGRHLRTYSDMEREHILDYIHGKGYVLGESEVVEVSRFYELDEDALEFWWDKDKKLVSRIVVSGVSNDYHKRDEMNMIYFQNLEQNCKPWPWPFQKKNYGFFRSCTKRLEKAV